jgi:hypothetical protein
MNITTFGALALLGASLISCGGGGSPPPPPTAFDQDTSIPVNSSLSDTLAANNVDYSTCTFSIVTDPDNGHISYDLDTGSFTYVPDNNFVGIDTFYWVVDDQWGDSNVAEYTIGVGVSAQTTNHMHQALAQR